DLLPRAQGGECFEPDINAHLLPDLRQGQRLGTLAREADVPLAGAATPDGGRLRRAFEGPMQDNPHRSDVHDAQALRIRLHLTADWQLRESETVVAPFPSEAGIARRLPGSTATEEGLEGEVNAHRDVLQHLRLDACQCGPLGPERGQCRVLVVEP